MKKAKEYYDEYQEELYNPQTEEDRRTLLCKSIFIDFANEVPKLYELRNAKTDAATIAILDEQNQKWNSMVRIFEKNKGFSILLKDGFKNMMQNWNLPVR